MTRPDLADVSYTFQKQVIHSSKIGCLLLSLVQCFTQEHLSNACSFLKLIFRVISLFKSLSSVFEMILEKKTVYKWTINKMEN